MGACFEILWPSILIRHRPRVVVWHTNTHINIRSELEIPSMPTQTTGWPILLHGRSPEDFSKIPSYFDPQRTVDDGIDAPSVLRVKAVAFRVYEGIASLPSGFPSRERT